MKMPVLAMASEAKKHYVAAGNSLIFDAVIEFVTKIEVVFGSRYGLILDCCRSLLWLQRRFWFIGE